jgi:DNA-binding transcriptional ArsR family regulator
MAGRKLKVKDFDQVALVGRCLSNAGRVEVMIALANEGTASPVMLAKRGLGVVSAESNPLTNVSYHCKKLYDAGLVDKVHVRPVRGSVEHFYDLTKRGRELAEVVAKLGA